MLRRVDRYIVTDLAKNRNGSIFVVKQPKRCLTLKMTLRPPETSEDLNGYNCCMLSCCYSLELMCNLKSILQLLRQCPATMQEGAKNNTGNIKLPASLRTDSSGGLGEETCGGTDHFSGYSPSSLVCWRRGATEDPALQLLDSRRITCCWCNTDSLLACLLTVRSTNEQCRLSSE
jgi:hypothetical protein